MEVTSLAVGAIAIGPPLLSAIRRLRHICDAVSDTSDVLNRLEQDGRTIHFYVESVDEAIRKDPSGYPPKFVSWYADEKRLLQRSTAQIEDYSRKLHQRSQSSPVVNGLKIAFDVTDIARVQEQLRNSMSAIAHMMAICRDQNSFITRAAALNGNKSKSLRARTSSSLASYGEPSCTVSSSLGDPDESRTYDEECRRSRAYIRVALKLLENDVNGGNGGASSTDSMPPSDPELGSAPGSSKEAAAKLQIDGPEPLNTDALPLSLSTHSSSLQSTIFSTQRGWSSAGDTTLLSSPLTTQTVDSFNHSESDSIEHKDLVPIRVEIEDLGSRETELDRGAGPVDIQAVNAVIQTLRDEILTAAGASATGASIQSKDKRIIAYKTTNVPDDCERFPLNAGFLAGAFEEADSGIYAKLEIFEIFALQEEEESRLVSLVLDARARDTALRGRLPLPFPSVDTVLQLQQYRTRGKGFRSSNFGSTASDKADWILSWVAQGFMNLGEASSIYEAMPEGPKYKDRHYIAQGGSSEVWRVEITASHSVHVREPGPFALKVLKPGYERTFKREVEAHMHLATLNDQHVTRLLMAYQQNSACYLLFPWADGNLLSVWQSQDITPSQRVVRWALEQMYGLAQALTALHIPIQTRSQVGWHGDIKPENILWFKGGAGDKLGRLQLSDFGLSEFHRTDKWFRSPRGARGGTEAYAPPEALSDSSPRSFQAADVWSLGCVFSEIITWLVRGSEEVKRFRRARLSNVHNNRHRSPGLLMSTQLSWIKAFVECQGPAEDDPRLGTSEGPLRELYQIAKMCLNHRPSKRPTATEVSNSLRAALEKLSVASGACFLDDCIAGAPWCKPALGLLSKPGMTPFQFMHQTAYDFLVVPQESSASAANFQRRILGMGGCGFDGALKSPLFTLGGREEGLDDGRNRDLIGYSPSCLPPWDEEPSMNAFYLSWVSIFYPIHGDLGLKLASVEASGSLPTAQKLSWRFPFISNTQDADSCWRCRGSYQKCRPEVKPYYRCVATRTRSNTLCGPGPIRQIRLLRLAPHRDEPAPIRHEIFECPISQGSYEALSYTWGSPDNPQPIQVSEWSQYGEDDVGGVSSRRNSRKLSFVANLLESLTHPPRSCANHSLWIGTLCINQDDVHERRQQVAQMGQIYASIDRVHVWLGEDYSDGSDGASKELKIAQGWESGYDRRADHRHHTGLNPLSRHSWFRRKWLLQEVAISPQVIGETSHLGDSATLHLLMKDTFDRSQQTRNGTGDETNSPFALQLAPLVDLMHIFVTGFATRAEDSIYALLGIASDPPDDSDLTPVHRTLFDAHSLNLLERPGQCEVVYSVEYTSASGWSEMLERWAANYLATFWITECSGPGSQSLREGNETHRGGIEQVESQLPGKGRSAEAIRLGASAGLALMIRRGGLGARLNLFHYGAGEGACDDVLLLEFR